ncbi:GNAT family N-acetyltransferase [Cellulophaga sp. L1A9]|uniref:GNAT family N-acetyltransferase n=1 Tax=Cellulophaga sp. L1A9 TaxID=2686362 RepID=UPI00131C5F21|nr:GNAT family N-acetyltransferase [Cellulophaga sp. L1A9]
MYKEFQTERLWIKPTLKPDAELIYQLMNTPKFIQYIGDRGISTIEDAEKYIQDIMLPQLDSLGYSSYTISRKLNGDKIGTCGLYNREGLDGIDIGFGLLPGYEGLGYAYEATHEILKAAFEVFEIKELKAITSKENFSSLKLLEKLGLKKIGVTNLPNDSKELLLYKIEK